MTPKFPQPFKVLPILTSASIYLQASSNNLNTTPNQDTFSNCPTFHPSLPSHQPPSLPPSPQPLGTQPWTPPRTPHPPPAQLLGGSTCGRGQSCSDRTGPSTKTIMRCRYPPNEMAGPSFSFIPPYPSLSWTFAFLWATRPLSQRNKESR